MNDQLKFLMPNRLKDFYEVGPVQRAAVEDFVDVVLADERNKFVNFLMDLHADYESSHNYYHFAANLFKEKTHE